VKPSKYESSGLAMKILYIGLGICVGGTVVLYFGGLILDQYGFISEVPAGDLQTLGYALLAVSAVELGVVFLLKRKWFRAENPMFAGAKSYRQLKGQILTLYIILYFIALSPSIYGFLFYILGGNKDLFTLICCLTLLGYMMVRPRPDFIHKLVEPFDFPDLD